MNSRQIKSLIQSGKFEHAFTNRQLVETHISYVILGRRFAYKFKKSIQYSFLDFSTLKKRKYYCEREVVLNNRLSKGVYLGVVPVRREKKQIFIGRTKGKIFDYAIKMKRLKDGKQMHLMLEHKQVTQNHIQMLALALRNFHDRTEVIHPVFNPDHFASRFNDILSVSEYIHSVLGTAPVKIIEKAVRRSDQFLKDYRDLFIQRNENGFVRDCHGDLHSRNIFLYHKPIIFDCLEFNDEFRKIDVLDELAFFCMDLEVAGFKNLSEVFTDYYFAGDQNNFGIREHLLFTYYKSYRANVRAKVNALRAMKAEEPLKKKRLGDVIKYLALMDSYLGEVSEL